MAATQQKKKKKGWLWILLILVIVAAAVIFVLPRIILSTQPTAVSSYTVKRGDVDVTITGSGKLEADDTLDIDLPVGVKVDTIFVKEGDQVKAGDVLAAMDTASLRYRAAELSTELTALDRQLGSWKTASSINAPVKGRVKYLPAVADMDVVEAVNQFGCLAILSTDGLMQLSLPTDATLTLAAEVDVRWADGSATGKVASRIDGGYLVTLDDDKAPYLAQAEVWGEGVRLGSGTLEIHTPVAIFGNGGTIAKVEAKVNDQLYAGGKLFTLDNEPATDSYRQTLADRTDKAAQLQTVLRYQSSPSVLAEADGVIGEITIAEGKELASASGEAEITAFTLQTGGAVRMTIRVDELDVNTVRVGQDATITLDAFSTESFAATVTRISHIGVASGSITNYQTDLVLAYDERLLDGMNGSAVILAASARDVPVIPLAAIHEDADGSYVYLLDAKDERTKLYIETGLADGANAQVVRGLSEGDRIEYTDPNASTGLTFPFGGGAMIRNGGFGGASSVGGSGGTDDGQ